MAYLSGLLGDAPCPPLGVMRIFCHYSSSINAKCGQSILSKIVKIIVPWCLQCLNPFGAIVIIILFIIDIVQIVGL